ncbi:MAG TPA: hypothetical protein VGL75_09355 [Acidothermaceae bacterium]|jgi:hypothetical protein
MTGPTPAEILRAPFPEDQIGKLPKIYCTPCARSEAKVCTNPQHTKVRCEVCKGTITSAHLHLDYVGHAAVTDRLLKADPQWSWEPLAFDENGLPRLDAHGGLWIRLTVAGVTRLGYGDAQGKSGNNAIKETLGDAIRNSAMRFGVALDLWSKEDLTPQEHDDGVVPMAAAAAPRTRGRRAEAPAAEPATDAAPAGVDGKTELAQTLADTAAMVKTTTLLRGVHTTAKEKSLLTVKIVVPVTGEAMLLSKYIADRKAEIERPEQPRPIERAPVPEPENGKPASQPDVDPVSQETALASFYDAAKRAGLSKSEADNKFWVETGRGVLEADPAALLAFIHAGAA